MLLPERFKLRFIARHQRFRGQVREPGGKQLFVTIAQALRLIDDQRAFFFCTFKDIGGVDKFGIERRVLTHQHHVQRGEFDILLAAKLVPFVVVLLDGKQTGTRTGFAVDQVKIRHFHIVQFVATTLRFEQHGEAGVFFDINLRDGVHHDAELNHRLLRLTQIAKTHLQRGNGGKGSCLCAQYAGSQQNISKLVARGHGDFVCRQPAFRANQ